MATVTPQTRIELRLTLTLDEAEARALHALTDYGADEFLKVFYQHLGRSGLQPAEGGLRSLFAGVRAQLPAVLERLDGAREVFTPAKSTL